MLNNVMGMCLMKWPEYQQEKADADDETTEQETGEGRKRGKKCERCMTMHWAGSVL